MQIRKLTVILLSSLFLLGACTPFEDTTYTAKAVKVFDSGEPDKYGVVCYTTRYRGEFSCVKVENK